MRQPPMSPNVPWSNSDLQTWRSTETQMTSCSARICVYATPFTQRRDTIRSLDRRAGPCAIAYRRDGRRPWMLLQERGEILVDLLRLVRRRVTPHHVALAVDQEFGEIPLDRFRAQHARRGVLEVSIKRMRVRAIDVDLGKQRERHRVLRRTEVADFLGVAWLLVPELVAGKAQHLETAILVRAVQRFKALVLRRESALRGHVDDQQSLAAIRIELLRHAVQQIRFEVISRGHRITSGANTNGSVALTTGHPNEKRPGLRGVFCQAGTRFRQA